MRTAIKAYRLIISGIQHVFQNVFRVTADGHDRITADGDPRVTADSEQ